MPRNVVDSVHRYNRLALCHVVLVLISMPLLPQESPPKLLLIVQEHLKANRAIEFGTVERETASICSRLNCPHPYLALESLTGSKQVWWFNEAGSQEEWQRVERAYQRNEDLMSELLRNSQRKEALKDETRTIWTTHRSDLSMECSWRVGGARFFVITVTTEERKAKGCVFEAEDRTRFIIMPAATRADADRISKIAGGQTQVFALQPAWSHAADAWIAADPEFWRESPADQNRSARRPGGKAP